MKLSFRDVRYTVNNGVTICTAWVTDPKFPEFSYKCTGKVVLKKADSNNPVYAKRVARVKMEMGAYRGILARLGRVKDLEYQIKRLQEEAAFHKKCVKCLKHDHKYLNNLIKEGPKS